MDEAWQEFLHDLEAVRAVTPRIGVETRDAGDGDDGMPTLFGHFSVFNRWYEINSIFEGRFLERIAPGAFTKTFAESRDAIKVLFDHGYDPTIGGKVLGRKDQLREDDVGAYYEVPLLDTSYNRDLVPGLEAGEYGASFRFRPIKDQWDDEPDRSDHNPDGIPERTLTEVRVFEFGPVTFPASPGATAGVRSMTDEFYGRARAQDPAHYDQLLARSREARTPHRGAADTTDEPRARTRRHAERRQYVRRLTTTTS